MFAHHFAVHPHGRTKLRLVDFENGGGFSPGWSEGSPVPEVIPLLTGHPRIGHKSRSRKLAVVDEVHDVLPAVELVYIRKCRPRRVRQSRNRSRMIERFRHVRSGNRIGNLPDAIERNRNTLRGAEPGKAAETDGDASGTKH